MYGWKMYDSRIHDKIRDEFIFLGVHHTGQPRSVRCRTSLSGMVEGTSVICKDLVTTAPKGRPTFLTTWGKGHHSMWSVNNNTNSGGMN